MLAVIGTAGRNTDAARLSVELYDAMYHRLLSAMTAWGVRDLCSGGAAWADHLAVRAFLDGQTTSPLRLFLPATFENGRYGGSRPNDVARTANRYHDQFSRVVGFDTLGQIAEAIAKGAKVSSHPGFKTRNLEVAEAATYVLAFTFGAGRPPVVFGDADPAISDALEAGCKDGGTAHTFTRAYRAEAKLHVDLGWLSEQPAVAPPAPR